MLGHALHLPQIQQVAHLKLSCKGLASVTTSLLGNCSNFGQPRQAEHGLFLGLLAVALKSLLSCCVLASLLLGRDSRIGLGGRCGSLRGIAMANGWWIALALEAKVARVAERHG